MNDEDHFHTAHSLQNERWLKRLEVLLIGSGTLALFLMMFLSVGDALLRSFFDSPIFGANDLTQIGLSIVVSISLPLCVLAGRLVAIDTLIKLAPSYLERSANWLVTGLSVIMLAYIAWRSVLNALSAADFGETTLLLQLSFAPSYYVISAGSAASALLLFIKMVKEWRSN